MKVEGYESLAEAKGQELVYYAQYGSYQGEWLEITADNDYIYIYKDWYGSCLVCDALEAEGFDWGRDYDRLDTKVQDFFDGYRPYLIILRDVARGLLSDLACLLPRNVDYNNRESDIKEAVDALSEYLNRGDRRANE